MRISSRAVSGRGFRCVSDIVNKPSDWALLARYLSGECTEEEKAEVESAIASDPEKQRLTRFMRSLWDTPEPPARPSDVDRLWDELAGKTWLAAGSGAVQDPGRRGMGRRLVEWLQPQPKLARYCAAAAALLIVSSLAYHGFQETGIYPSSRPARLSTLAVESSASDELTLSDGTRIRLDAGSTLRYPESFRGDGRSVFLSGEGYFEVAPDADRPFRVHLDGAVVEVLGTRFNVRAWETEQRVTVAVAEGRVAFHSEREKGDVEIGPGQMSTLTESGPPAGPSPADIDRHLGWMRREAFFDDAPLRDVLFQLERWYGVQFALEDTSLAAERLSVYIKGESLEDVLELISVLTGLDGRRDDRRILLQPGGMGD